MSTGPMIDNSSEADTIVARKRHGHNEDHFGSSKKQKQSEELNRNAQASTKAENQRKCVIEISEAWGEDYKSWPTHQFAPLCAKSSKSGIENEDDRKTPSRWHLNLLRPVVELLKLTAESEVVKRALQEAIDTRLAEPGSSESSNAMTTQDVRTAITNIKMGVWTEREDEETQLPRSAVSAMAAPRPSKVDHAPDLEQRASGQVTISYVRENSQTMSIADEDARVVRNKMPVPNYFPDPHAREHDEILEKLLGREEDAEDGFIRENVRQYISFMKTKKALDQERKDVYRKMAEIDRKARNLNETRKEILGLGRFRDRDGRQGSPLRVGSEEL